MPGRISAQVNTYDTALTVAWIFHIEPSQCWIGRPVLTAFSPAMVAAQTNVAARAPLSDCVQGAHLSGAVLAEHTGKSSPGVSHPGQVN